MREKIIELLEKLNGYRDEVLNLYLSSFDSYDPKNGSMEVIERAGILHDLDKHITNLEMEIKRFESLELFNGKVK